MGLVLLSILFFITCSLFVGDANSMRRLIITCALGVGYIETTLYKSQAYSLFGIVLILFGFCLFILLSKTRKG